MDIKSSNQYSSRNLGKMSIRLFLLFLIISVLVLFYQYLPDKYSFEGLIIFSMVMIVFFTIYNYHYNYKNILSFFSPLYFFLLPYSIYFIIFPIDMIINDRILTKSQNKYLPTLMVFLLLGLSFFIIGFFMGLKKDNAYPKTMFRENIKIAFNINRAVLMIAFSSVMAVLIGLMLINLGGGISKILNDIGSAYSEVYTKQVYLISINIGFIMLNLVTHMALVAVRKKGHFLFFCNALLMFFILLFQGSRGSILSVYLILAVLYHIFFRKINFLKVFALLIIVIIFLISAIYVRDVISEVPLSDVLYGALLYVNDEMTTLLSLADGVPSQLDFQYGKTYLQLFITPIPRFVWEAKPQAISVITTKTFLPQYEWVSLTWPISIIGELYINFTWFGIIPGMFLFGYLSGKLQRYVLKNISFFLVAIYGASLYCILQEVRGDFVSVTGIASVKLLTFIFCAKFVFNKSKRRRVCRAN